MARGPGAQAQGLTTMAKAAEDGNLDMIAINDHIVVPTDIDSAYPYTNTGVWPGAAAGECLEGKPRAASARARAGAGGRGGGARAWRIAIATANGQADGS